MNGTIAALNRILDDDGGVVASAGGTQVIPDRGRIYDEGDVAEYRDMVTIVRDRVRDAIGKGRDARADASRATRARLRRPLWAATGPASAERVHRDGVSQPHGATNRVCVDAYAHGGRARCMACRT